MKTIEIKKGNVKVKIYPRTRRNAEGKKARFFQVADYTSGKRVFRGFNNEQTARDEAEKIANLLATGESTAAGLRNGDAAAYGLAVAKLAPLNIGLVEAVSLFCKAAEILGSDSLIDAANFYKRHNGASLTHKTVDAVVEECLAAKKARGCSDVYLVNLKSQLSKFAGSFKVNISSITGPDVQRWLDGMTGATTSKKNLRAAVSILFTFAESHGYIMKGANPVNETEKIDADTTGAIEIYTPEEIAALLKSAPEAFVPVMALAAFAGVRMAEITRLDWKHIDLDGGYIHAAAHITKTRARRLIPISENLKAWLAPRAKKAGLVWTGNADSAQDARNQAAAGAGIEWRDNALRHSYISYRLAAIQDVNKVAYESGNSPEMIFKHYRELVKPEAAARWFAVNP